ncbi:TPA: VanA-type vancomycin resistance histidine kinase VanS, partial [Enterococcus faecium]
MVIKLKNKKNDYSKLERKLYMYIVAIVVVAIVFVLYIRSMIRGKLGD